MNGNNNRQTRVNRARPNRSNNNTIARSIDGHANNMRWTNPPQVNSRPWYPLVLSLVTPSAGTEVFWTPSELINSLCSQLGLPSQASSIINIKIRRVDAFTMATGASTDRPAISMDVSSVTPSLGDPATPGNAEVFYGILKKLKDQGNLSDAAKVSYTWPRAMQQVPLSSQSVFSLVSTAGNQPNTNVRFHLLWSCTDIATPQ